MEQNQDQPKVWWHQAAGGQSKGPFSEAQMRQLHAEGVITLNTLVWREGMVNETPWSASELAKPPQPPTPPLPQTGYSPRGLGALWGWTAWLYAAGMAVVSVGAFWLDYLAPGSEATFEYVSILFLVGVVALLGGIVLWLTLLYRLWSLIQDGLARTQPWKAVVFMLIPLVNLFYLFVNFEGLAKGLNAAMERHAIQGPKADVTKAYLAAIFMLVDFFFQRIPLLGDLLFIPAVIFFVLATRSLVGAGQAVAAANAASASPKAQPQPA